MNNESCCTVSEFVQYIFVAGLLMLGVLYGLFALTMVIGFVQALLL